MGVLADVRLGEFHTSEAEVTDYAVEGGGRVGDHVVLLPDTLEIHIQMSNYDLPGMPLLGLRATTLFQTMKAAKNSRERFEVLTNHELYSDMVLTRIQGDHSAPYRGRLDMVLGFKKVDPVQLSFSELPESSLAPGDTAKTASSPVNGGRQDPVKAADNRSLLARIADNL